jgi:ketosteroid isomerase-like protein
MLVAAADPAVEWHSLFAGLERRGVYRGHSGTRQYMDDLDEAWEVGLAEVDDALSTGSTAFLVGRIRYRGRESGVENTTEVCWVLRFRSGKLLQFRAFRDPEKVLALLGQDS